MNNFFKSSPRKSSRRNATGVAMALLLCGNVPAFAANPGTETNAPAAAPAPAAPLTYDSFRLITDRNIFDGNRSGQRIRSTRSSSQQRSVRVDSFTLVGTLVTGSGSTAFFDGTESAFRKALKPGSSVAGFELVDIQYAGARLKEGTNTIDLKVGAGFRREDYGPWKSTGAASQYVGTSSAHAQPTPDAGAAPASEGSDATSDSTNADAPPAAESAPPAPVEMNDVLRRLMEKREKE